MKKRKNIQSKAEYELSRKMKVDFAYRAEHKIYPQTYDYDGIDPKVIALTRAIDKRARKNEWALAVAAHKPYQAREADPATSTARTTRTYAVSLLDQRYGTFVPKEFVPCYQAAVNEIANGQQMKITWMSPMTFTWELTSTTPMETYSVEWQLDQYNANGFQPILIDQYGLPTGLQNPAAAESEDGLRGTSLLE